MNKINKFILSTIALSILSSTTTATAAQKINLRDNVQQLSAISSATTSITAPNTAQLLGLASNEGLSVVKTYLDSDGGVTTRYQQMFNDIPVIGDHAIISRYSDGTIKNAHGAVVYGITTDIINTTPRIAEKTALDKAKMLSAPASPLLVGDSVSVENETSKLAIWQDEDGVARLVYEISFLQHSDKPSRPYYIIDAQTGEVLKHFNNLQTADATGFGGNEKTGKYHYGTDFGYLNVGQSGNNCIMNNTNVKTINLNHGTNGSSAFSFTCPENTVKSINGAFSPLNDAHYFGGVVFDMYNDWINTAPLSFQLKMRVHYSKDYENAFWDGTAMTFGDGESYFYPLVSLDVSAHEVSHGFTEQNSGLVYEAKSGGLNEAFSDMAGEAAEFFMSGTNDWQVGAQIFKGNGALRYMDEPTRDGKSIDHQSNYNSGMDVHNTSGVYNKAFYNLATTVGWDTKKAFIVYAKANQLYWSANTNWDEAGNGVMDAACDLGYSTDEVKASLAAVGINSNASPGTSCGGTTPPDSKKILENGVTVTGLGTDSGDEIIYTMEVPAGASDIRFSMSGGNGDADLYVKLGSKPTNRIYDCRSYAVGNEESCDVTASGGTYYIRVKAYSAFSGLSLVGSYTTGSGGGNDVIDRTESNISVDRQQWKHFIQELNGGYASFTVTMSGGSGDVDLYVQHGAESSPERYDCRPYDLGNDERCTFDAPKAGTWYIDLYGYSTASDVELNIQANP
ncbi:M4 family metallopeptidase [Moritella viscosa]|uniref:Metallopeptidase n=1 Tax=Moritella viscosa TaxID=80854 RepID=A0ABY1HEW6_9GAMM|nr:pre-peptidase C-terminal domain-containing protein [Moritella viscosa]SGY89305.1 Metallopeptidase [Moritella viscosa]SGY93331.1 Metallopeptidase [Moritella viscosa]SGY97283.1 Metallopeptidase [Moritella viscosa]SHO25807.1 Metallopeptidase [Moritella viscosa]